MAHTHAELCAKAVKWLRRPASLEGPGCNFAVSECTGSYSGEIADAIGFRSIGEDRHSVLVEVKVTRADFLADARKPHRQNSGIGLGTYRYYLAPAGLIQLAELPPSWGLIEAVGRGLNVCAGHVLQPYIPCDRGRHRDLTGWHHESNAEREKELLVRLFERIGDPEAMHNKLKKIRAQVRQSEQTAASRQEDLSRVMKQYWDLRAEFKEVTGREPESGQTTPAANRLPAVEQSNVADATFQ